MCESVWWSNYIGRVLAVRLNADGVGAVTPMFVCRWSLVVDLRSGAEENPREALLPNSSKTLGALRTPLPIRSPVDETRWRRRSIVNGLEFGSSPLLRRTNCMNCFF
ncbi:hypothetical protein OPV22_009038 [Ensete ventricosum]|uniref:Uncharacterized protein n=1 Tax=Ensete ventricosum TaxID=4639 RepID=A0AAV8RE43_ENSVE|nr:hypothetical protein OPV22_009038 [Ensete ventricosum]